MPMGQLRVCKGRAKSHIINNFWGTSQTSTSVWDFPWKTSLAVNKIVGTDQLARALFQDLEKKMLTSLMLVGRFAHFPERLELNLFAFAVDLQYYCFWTEKRATSCRNHSMKTQTKTICAFSGLWSNCLLAWYVCAKRTSLRHLGSLHPKCMFCYSW